MQRDRDGCRPAFLINTHVCSPIYKTGQAASIRMDTLYSVKFIMVSYILSRKGVLGG